MPDLPFIQRLKERKLFQWVLAYLAGAFLVCQLMELMAEPWSITPTFQRTIHILLIIGVFVMAVIAWYHGEAGRQRVSGPELVIIALLLFLSGGVLSFLNGGDENTAQSDRPALALTGEGRPSIAVLPFANRSGREEDAYFADGIHDEILTRLSKIGGLSVRGRTSVMGYRESPKNLTLIGQELNARYILEGGVLRGADTVRINVQLVDAQNDTHLWAELYDREMSARNLLGVQSDIAQRVASALEVQLAPEERTRIQAKTTDNLDAYESYLKGKEYYERSGSLEQDRRLALQMMQRAVELDPGFAQAYAQLSVIHSSLWWLHYDRDPGRLDLAKEAVDRAIELQPDLPEAQVSLGYYYYWGHLDYERATESLLAALRSQPGNVNVFRGLAAVFRRRGQVEESLDYYREAVELDPRNESTFVNYGASFMLLRRYSEAEEQYRRAMLLTPDDPQVYQFLIANVLLPGDGNTGRALAVRRAAEEAGLRHNRLDFTFVMLDILDGKPAEALSRLEGLTWEVHESQFYFIPKPLYLARVYSLLGDRSLEIASFDSARTVLERRLEDQPDDTRMLSSLGIAYAGLGRVEEAIHEGERAVALLPVEQESWRGALRMNDLAQIYAMVGRPEEAIDELEHILSIPGTLSVSLIRLDPIWDPLRSHPRFQALLDEYRDDLEH